MTTSFASMTRWLVKMARKSYHGVSTRAHEAGDVQATGQANPAAILTDEDDVRDAAAILNEDHGGSRVRVVCEGEDTLLQLGQRYPGEDHFVRTANMFFENNLKIYVQLVNEDYEFGVPEGEHAALLRVLGYSFLSEVPTNDKNFIALVNVHGDHWLVAVHPDVLRRFPTLNGYLKTDRGDSTKWGIEKANKWNCIRAQFVSLFPNLYFDYVGRCGGDCMYEAVGIVVQLYDEVLKEKAEAGGTSLKRALVMSPSKPTGRDGGVRKAMAETMARRKAKAADVARKAKAADVARKAKAEVARKTNEEVLAAISRKNKATEEAKREREAVVRNAEAKSKAAAGSHTEDVKGASPNKVKVPRDRKEESMRARNEKKKKKKNSGSTGILSVDQVPCK